VSAERCTASPSASSSRKKIVFIKRGTFSGINASLRREIERQFPEYDLCEIDVGLDLLKRHPHILALNWLHVLALYGWAILWRRRPLGMCFYYTPYLARQIQRLLRARLVPEASQIAFSLATQSLYNARIPGVPHFVFTDHTHLANLRAPGFDPAFLANKEWIATERQVYREADRVFVMGENSRASLLEQYGEEASHVHCVYGGPNTGTVPPPLDNEEYGNQTILFVGLDWERKGGPELVAAFTLLTPRLPRAQLRIAGAAPAISHSNVEVLGPVPVQRIAQLLAEASLLCLPSRYEPFGIAILEAFAQGVPAVVTRVGALPYLVTDRVTGRVVEQGDIPALAEALEEMLSDPAKCRLYGEAARRVAAERFNWEATGLKIRHEIDAWFQERGAKSQ
jgi:glycosyltransferase involved in cell wall biosynthesis